MYLSNTPTLTHTHTEREREFRSKSEEGSMKYDDFVYGVENIKCEGT